MSRDRREAGGGWAAASGAAAIVTSAVGAMVVAGWLFDVAPLRTLVPGTNPMVVSTAACFLLTASALWLLRREGGSRGQVWLGRILALVAALIGLLKLGEYAFGWNLGIDQTLFVDDPGAFPGRMAVPTAISFVLVGAALVALDVETRRGWRPTEVLARLGLVLPGFGLLGRLYAVPTLSSLVAGTVVMALPTSITFLVLAGGIITARAHRGSMRITFSDGPAGYLIRRLLPAAVLLVVIAGGLRLAGQRAGLFGTELGTALMVAFTVIVLYVLISLSARSLHRSEALGRQADERAQETQHRMIQYLEQLPIGVFVIDTEGRPQYANRAAERILGQGAQPEAQQDQLAETYQAYVAGTDTLYPTERLPIVRALAGERSSVDDMEIRLPEGTPRLEVGGSPIRDRSGEVVSAMAVFNDITERKAAEEAVRQAQLAAEQARESADRANRAKSEFLSRMSHELRTPLNAVLGFGQLLEMDDLDQEHAEYVKHIIRGGRHLLDLINEVLDISRIETGQLSLSMEPVSVADVLRESLDLVRPMAHSSGIDLEVEGEELDGRHVLADRQRLKQVLLNLLSNAVKYNSDGGRVTVALGPSPERGVRLSVADTGPGIPAEMRERLFSPFDRLGAEQSGVEGTGLGLALTKGLVEAMGGDIGVASPKGTGSTFWVDLSPAESPEATVGAVPAATAEPAGSDRTVLYIEDNAANLRLVERALARRRHVHLLTAMEGREGLDLARRHRPDLVLLDLHLPDLQGDEVLRQLRADPATRDIRVVVVSADATDGRSGRLLAAGADGYLTKPLDIARFLALVDEVGAGRRT